MALFPYLHSSLELFFCEVLARNADGRQGLFGHASCISEGYLATSLGCLVARRKQLLMACEIEILLSFRLSFCLSFCLSFLLSSVIYETDR